jgi:hypothetical protein
MIIGAYQFGGIDVDGHAYTSDVIITPSVSSTRGGEKRATSWQSQISRTSWLPSRTLWWWAPDI